MKKIRAIISGGGTGGHIFPAVAIAGQLMEANPENEILFVGAEGRMEMEKVPAAGYRIVGLPVAGLQRRLTVSNLALPFKVLKSIRMAGKIIDGFRPDIAIGVGGYASAPLLWSACRKGIPTLIQEQNGYAGLTNKILGKKVDRICVAYDGMERFFPAEKIVKTGNPIRKGIVPEVISTHTFSLNEIALTACRLQQTGTIGVVENTAVGTRILPQASGTHSEKLLFRTYSGKYLVGRLNRNPPQRRKCNLIYRRTA